MKKLIISLLILFFSHQSILFANETEKTPLKTIKISLGYALDPCQGPILYALKHELFEKFGLKVEIMPATGGEEASRMVASKKADMGITKLPNHIVRVAKGMPLKRIATLVGVSTERLVTREDAINLAELKGKNIGFTTSNPDFSLLVLDKILEKQGLTRNDINLIAFSQGMVQAFITGQIDVMITATDPHDTKLLDEKKIAFKAYDYGEFGIPCFEQFIIFTHKDKEAEPYMTGFISALNMATSLIQASPHTAWQGICERFPEIDTSLNFQIWMSLCHKFKEAPKVIDIEGYKKLLEYMNTATVDGKPLLAKKIQLEDITANSSINSL